jgi:hypothetical protein
MDEITAPIRVVASLFIAERTTSPHVSRIVTARGESAAMADGLRLFDNFDHPALPPPRRRGTTDQRLVWDDGRPAIRTSRLVVAR